MTKAPTPTEKSKKQHKSANKNFDYTTIADRLKTVNWGNDGYPNGVVKPVYGIRNISALVGCWSSVYIRRIICKFLNVCPFDCTTVAVSGKVERS